MEKSALGAADGVGIKAENGYEKRRFGEMNGGCASMDPPPTAKSFPAQHSATKASPW